MNLARIATFALAAAAAALTGLAIPGAAEAGPRLTLANPQPDESRLKPGLGVRYAYPHDVRYLLEAEGWRTSKGVEDGPPLVGLDYPDKGRGARALTSKKTEKVIAYVDGYIRFDKAGEYRLQFWSNDGLRVRFGGEEVYLHDGRHVCDTLGWEEVTVPEPGWYELDVLFFQRLNTSCLMLKWQPPGGGEAWTPPSAYAHIPR